jgi:hydrogenase maturation protein HypF
MELEMAATDPADEAYEYAWADEEVLKIDPQPIIKGVVRDVEKGVPTSQVSDKYHATLIRMFTELCEIMKKKTHISRVALSGGCFQNSILLSGLLKLLEQKGFEVLTHKKVPANDGGIALGQAVIADAKLSR